MEDKLAVTPKPPPPVNPISCRARRASPAEPCARPKMILVRQIDAQSKLLANDKGAACWHVWKQESPGEYSVPASTINRNIVPTKSYIQRDGSIHGYKPEPGSGRPQRSKSVDTPIQDADSPTNMLVLASMSPRPPRQPEDHKIPAPPPAVGGMYVRRVRLKYVVCCRWIDNRRGTRGGRRGTGEDCHAHTLCVGPGLLSQNCQSSQVERSVSCLSSLCLDDVWDRQVVP